MHNYLVSVSARERPATPQHLFLLAGAHLAAAEVARMAAELLADPVVHTVTWSTISDLTAMPDSAALEVAFRPGVTDNEADSVLIGAHHLGITSLEVVRTLRHYPLTADADPAGLFNPLIQTTLTLAPGDDPAHRRAWYTHLLEVPGHQTARIVRVFLQSADDQELLRISREGVLALDLAEMQAIRTYFAHEEGRDPTDAELETVAQTWSEHCSHKTFKALVRYETRHADPDAASLPAERYPAYQRLQQNGEIDSLIKTFLMSATRQVLENRPPDTEFAVLSAFVDNAGIMAFNATHEVSFKVETHNHPSALEPFGGANTGVGGVVRDVLGVSAQPIANTDVLCFGPLTLPDAQLPSGVLPPRRIVAGVVAGVRDYGNKLGIPTINGAVLYDPGYVANPLVFCGTVGLAPRGRHPRNVQPDDYVVVIGGRTGRDGIHGATFSSIELTHTTAEEVGSAVQIGDPITEKKMLDVILQARDQGLYSAITDCGAGGLSSAVGEMGAEIGVSVLLDNVPLKYAGLQPWEIWLSEAQERMVLAVPPAHLDTFLALCKAEDVEATLIGRFTDTGRLLVTYHGNRVVDLSMDFLHNRRPRRTLAAVWNPAPTEAQPIATAPTPAEALLELLAHPNITSKAPIIRSYDHEVQGRTVIKPLVGAQSDGPGDAAVLQPLRSDTRGIVIGCGINPRYGQHDPYWMALACVDEALRNITAVGGDPTQAAILDNFCWGDPRKTDRMAALVRAAAGCYDAALAFGAPFISGKDSLNNEYQAADGSRRAIPPTLLISAMAIMPAVQAAISMDLKESGNLLYLIGATHDTFGGAHYPYRANTEPPRVDLERAPRILAALHQAMRAGLVRACHDLSEGGLAVAIAEMALAGCLGAQIELARAPRNPADSQDDIILFAETPTRLLAEVRPTDADAFEAALAGLPHARIGTVTDDAALEIIGFSGVPIITLPVETLRAAWQGTPVV